MHIITIILFVIAHQVLQGFPSIPASRNIYVSMWQIKCLTCWCWSADAASLMIHSGVSEGYVGRHEVADDQFQHGSSTGCRQLGQNTKQICGCWWGLFDFTASLAAIQGAHIVWEHGRMRRLPYTWLQARQQDVCCKKSMILSSSSSLFDLTVSTSRTHPCLICGETVLTDIFDNEISSLNVIHFLMWFLMNTDS